jgi:hypothetical protein
MSDVPRLTRPAFFDGQALTAADLNAVQSYHRDLLWLHQRTMHSSGIASGLSVTGRKGDKSVTIVPGYAIDLAGRSIILDTTKVLDIPAAAPTGDPAAYYLTIAYVPDDGLAATVRRGACELNGAVWRAEQPSLRWKNPKDAAQDIVLCGIKVFDCKLSEPVDLSLRRSALPDKQPFVFAGWSPHDRSKWDLWKEGTAVFGLQATVNTSEAGFVNIPIYHAMVVGDRTTKNDTTGEIAAVDGHVHVESATADGFELKMTLPKGSALVNPVWLRAEKLKALPTDNDWFVSWVGVEY